MGYVLKKRTFLLKFEDREGLDSFDGLEVRCRSTSIRRYYELIDIAINAEGEYQDRRGHQRALADEFAGLLVSWNLQDEDGTPVPATADGILDQEESFLAMLFSAWIDAVASVPAPLGRPSFDGERSGAPSMETVSLSDSLESQLMPI